jgi:hypothetical protein
MPGHRPPRPCSIEGCVSPSKARGWCSKHYQRWVRNQDPMKTVVAAAGSARDWLTVHVGHEGDECLTWPYSRGAGGYASHYGFVPARVMCEMVCGKPPSPAHEAAHACGNGHLACVNPRHLRWATPKENSADRKLHGRERLGEDQIEAKLRNSDVIAIRALSGSQVELARQFGVSPTTIAKVQQRKTWKHIP